MKLVQQTNSWDCGAACLAMVLERSIYEVHDLLGRDCSEDASLLPGEPKKLGVTLDEIGNLLWNDGHLCAYFYAKCCFTEDDSRYLYYERMRLIDLSDVAHHLKKGGMAILGVCSKTGSGHWVVIKDEIVYDPLAQAPYPLGSTTLVTDCGVLIGSRKL